MQCSKKQAGRPMVSVEQGKLLGRRRKTKSGTGYASYTRIPFAAPPTGGRRFMHPSDPPPWEGVLDGGRPCPKPLQSNYVTGLLEGQEDCLYLNVYVPDTGDRPGVLPVMYWLYGGGFIMGDATEENYLPGPLLDTKQVVIVTANYRVGPLGFLCMEDNLLPGNLALWDQRAGLLWVKQNIHKFGGDPGNVTIFGESAGSFCLMCLYTSPLCRGLFHRAIAQSGPLISNCSALQVLGKTPQLYARSYAERLGCARSDSSEKILEYLKSVSAVRLQAIFNFAGDWAPMCPSPWKPVVDVWADTPILPKDPRQALLDGDVQCVPLITGTCRDEGLLNMSHILKEPVRWNLFSDPSWWKYLSMVLFHSHTEDLDTQDRDIMLKIAKEYDLLVPGESTILTPTTSRNSKHSKDEKIDRSEKLIQLFTDSYFKAGTLDLCQIIAQQNVPVYQYRFVYKGKWKFGDLLTLSAGGLAFKFILDTVSKGKVTLHGPLWEGVCHADELHYLFSPKLWGMKNTLADHRDKEMSRQLSTHWVNFASTGDPSTQVRWERTEVDGSNYLEIDIDEIMKEYDQDELKKCNLWKEIFRERGMRTVPGTLLQLKPEPIVKRIVKST